MSEESTLYEQANGSPLIGYLLLKSQGGNVPPQWINRYKKSRKNKQDVVAITLRKSNWKGFASLREWEDTYLKECFYNGIRILFELEREGQSNR